MGERRALGFELRSSSCRSLSGMTRPISQDRYYRMFTSLYANSLLFSDHVSTNSSWTQAHVKSLLIVGRASFLARLLLLIKKPSSRTKDEERTDCEVVYPPCDTAALVKLGNLNGRKREIVSLAQFR